MATTQSKKVTSKVMTAEFANVAYAAAGAITAGLAAQQVDKLLKADTAPTNLKKFGTPVAILGAALLIGLKSKDPRVKHAMLGAGASATNNLAKKIAPRIMGNLAGVEGENDLGLVPISSVYNQGYGPIGGYDAYADAVGFVPPASNSGYYIDSPAYVGAIEETASYEQVYGPEETYVEGVDGLDGSRSGGRMPKKEIYL